MKAVKNLTETISEKISDAVTGVSTSSVTHANTFTRATGCPFAEIKNSKTAGPNGPLVSDPELFEKLQRFDREKIPARNVHALGHGAYGKFTVTNDITRYTKASVFSRVGKTTELFARFSGIFTEQGEADTSRDPRGLAYKFYTDEGNWDLMTINTPVFAVRDSKPGPDQVHAFKRDPRSGLWNADQLWDFIATHPEGLHQGAMLFTDYYGTPCSYRFMEGYGCNTYSLINANNERVWVKFHLKNLQGGVRGFTAQQAKVIAGEDANFLGRDLWQAIEKGNYPKWRLMIQVMPEEEGYIKNFAFDCTKAWPQDQYPLIEVGEIEINRNPVNYFAEVEQVAFSPATIVPGIGHSPDKLLQGRLLIYDDTQCHRIGPNYKQLYINRPHGIEPQNNYYGGNMNLEVKDKFPHYTPSTFGSLMPDKRAVEPPLRCDGPADYYDYPGEGSDEDYYGQVREYWNLLPQDQKINMCDNIASSLGQVKQQRIIDMMLGHFNKISPDWGNLVKQKIDDRRMGKGLTDSEIMCLKFAKELLSESKSTV